jgi:hypothetical protein
MLSPVLMFALHSAAAPANTDAAPRMVSVEAHSANLQNSVGKPQELSNDAKQRAPVVVTKTIAHVHADGSISFDCKTEHPQLQNDLPTEPR